MRRGRRFGDPMDPLHVRPAYVNDPPEDAPCPCEDGEWCRVHRDHPLYQPIEEEEAA